MKTLLIDNYDSFTYNLYHLLARVNGSPPHVVRHDEVDWEGILKGDFDNIVLSPGPGHPGRPRDFGVCADVLRHATIPVLGICLGCQGLAVAFGGSVVGAREPMHGRASAILHDGSPLFEGLPQEFKAIRYHSLVVAEPLPESLIRMAWTHEGVVMGLRHRDRPLYGVQFHPESICTEFGERLVENFYRITRTVRPDRGCGVAAGGGPTALAGNVSSREVPESRRRQRHLLVHALDGWRDPESVFFALFRDDPRAFWLDSSLVRPSRGCWSYLGSGDTWLTYRVPEGPGDGGCPGETRPSIFETLEAELNVELVGDVTPPFAFLGGLVGYLGYELKVECGGQASTTSSWPDAGFLRVGRFLAFDHERQRVYLATSDAGSTVSPASRAWLDRMARAFGEVSATSALPQPKGPESPPCEWTASRSREEYLADVRRCQAEIVAGESYEICLTTRHTCSVALDPLAFYRVARDLNPVPYGAFLRMPGFTVAGCSPERFLRVDRGGHVEAKPIKGTMRRGVNPEDDAGRLAALHRSEKNRSENLMIVDLVRHDLGRVCDVGSVHVAELMAIETYASVHQMVSTIRGCLCQGQSAVACARAAFPPGSMTGAPKLRTLEILDRLEATARGVYSGCLGYFSFDGAADLSVVIRTAIIEPERLVVGAGGAVVALSDPGQEYDEMLLKAAVMKQVLQVLVSPA